MRKCFLHIGTHKTGTTAIQVQLNSNRRQLAEHGFLYPKTGIPSPFAGHHNIAWEVRGDRRFTPGLGTVDDLFSEIGKSDHDVILSSEDFECAADNLGSFISRLEQQELKVEVIIYFRDQVSYLQTLYLGLISHQRYDRTFGEFLSEAVEHRVVRWHEWIFVFDYRVLLSQLPPTSTIIARPFRPQISVVSDFASVLGLSPSDVNMDPNFRANAQEPISLAIAGLYRNRMGRNIKRDCKQTTLAIARAFDGADIALGITNKRRLIDAFEASNHWMDERYGMPMLAGMGQDVSGPAPAPGSGLDLEAVFSTATLKLIDELCRLETRRKWRVFGWGRRP
jgi:hypothetical protein